MRTITQAAEELEVSRTKIYNEITRLKITTKRVSKNNYIEDSDFEKIKEVVSNDTVKTNETASERLKDVLERDRNVQYNNLSDREYYDLKERISSLETQIGIKDEQLKIKDEQIQAKDNQINGLIQLNLNYTKALSPPFDEVAATTIEPVIKKGFWSKLFGK